MRSGTVNRIGTAPDVGIPPVGHGRRIRFEDLRAVAIERDERHERPLRRGLPLVRLQEHVERTIGREPPRHARDQLLPVGHERIGCLRGDLLLHGVERVARATRWLVSTTVLMARRTASRSRFGP